MSDLAKDAAILENWLVELVKKRGMPNYIEKNYLLQRGPNSLRNKACLTWALETLQATNRLVVQIYADNSGKHRKTVIILNDSFFGNIARGQQPFGYFPPLG